MRRYPAIQFRQTNNSAPIVLFSAPATDIDDWSGVPQRELLDGHETVGFQREENKNRLTQLQSFYDNPKNVVQNTLLCAAQDLESIRFITAGPTEIQAVTFGHLEVTETNLENLTIQDLFEKLKSSLEVRSVELRGTPVNDSQVDALTRRLNQEYDYEFPTSDVDASDEEPEPSDESVDGLFESETHILEFYQEVAARCVVLEKLSASEVDKHYHGFLGFTRDAIESYLKPIMLVDGQHRLKGALLSAEAAAQEEIRQIVDLPDDTEDEKFVRHLVAKNSRLLPVSLLMSADPQEHVFQFVVVNQKATPVGKALLGTIVSTSLTSSELEDVGSRLEQVGIDVVDSQAVAWFTRNPSSPFYQLVQQGISREQGGKLPWNVLRDLLSKFRNLSGGRLFHDRIDYADQWAKEQLQKSKIVPDELSTVQERKEYWSKVDGPWRSIASEFFVAVRDKLGNKDNEDADNYWGLTKSNLYNKQSLSILVADFFQWLVDREETIDGVEEVRPLVEKWLSKTSADYFARPWDLSGVKKDTPGIRAQWSELWVTYRKTGARPDYRNYRKARIVG